MSAADGIRRGTPSDAAAAAALHIVSISIGFLVVLGERFLERLYRRVAADDRSFLLVHVDPANGVDGFVAVTEDTGRLYREFMSRDGVHAGLRAASAVLRHPWKVIETFRYGMDGRSAKPGAEILATAVAGNSRGEGIGRALVATAMDELRRRGVEHAHVVTAANNEAAQRAYFACGFQRHSTVEVHHGVVQEVLVWP
jgi:ribosomal protein S18 acetylase RimI-like enzyme